jgi:tetratricopeptide (TPR) repeat protein
MSETSKENSSLELYETAYKLQYADGNIPEACRIYKALIDEFPNSNECGYAVIQLQKILANDVSDRIKTGKKNIVPLLITAICLIASISFAVIALMSAQKAKAEIQALSLVSQALSIMYGGNDNEALELLNRAKVLSGGELMDPYLLSATIYMNMQNFSRARNEFETYQKLTGKSDSVFMKLVTVRNEKDKMEKAVMAKADSFAQSPAASAGEANPSAATFKPERMPPPQQSSVKPRPRLERPRATAPRPSRKASPSVPDSVSFF